MKKKIKKVYCIHPGKVLSANDGEMHFVDASRLIELYKIDPEICSIFRGPEDHAHKWNHNLLCLYPRYDDKYDVGIVEEEFYA